MGKKIIIVVEDNSDMQSILKTSLTEAGFSVFVTKEGGEALSEAESGKIDLMILDLMLPGIDGMTVLKKMRERGIGVPVIILTNLSSDEHIMEGIIRDVPSYYLIKSDTPIEDLVTKVKTTLGV